MNTSLRRLHLSQSAQALTDDEKLLSPFPIMGLGAAMEPLIKAGAAGAVIVMPLPFDAVEGSLYL